MHRERLAIGFWVGHAAGVLFLGSMVLPAESGGVPGGALALLALFGCLGLRGANPDAAAACVLGTMTNLLFVPNYIFFLVQCFCPDDYRRRTPVLSTSLGFAACVSCLLVDDFHPSRASVGGVAWIAASGLLMAAAWLRWQPRISARPVPVLPAIPMEPGKH